MKPLPVAALLALFAIPAMAPQGMAQDVTSMVLAMDANTDGAVSRAEFTLDADLFDTLDANGDGLISQADSIDMGLPGQDRIDAAMKSADGQNAHAASVAHFDLNGDGTLSAEERDMMGPLGALYGDASGGAAGSLSGADLSGLVEMLQSSGAGSDADINAIMQQLGR